MTTKTDESENLGDVTDAKALPKIEDKMIPIFVMGKR